MDEQAERRETAGATARVRVAAKDVAPKDKVPRPGRTARKAKPTRWSARRAERFLERLAQTSNVALSARASGLSESTIYRRRAKDDAFRVRWTAALREGVARLETMLLDRALNGVRKPVWHGGKRVGTMTEYSDRLALALLAAHRGSAAAAAAGEEAPAQSADEVRSEFLRRLSEMNRGMGGTG